MTYSVSKVTIYLFATVLSYLEVLHAQTLNSPRITSWGNWGHSQSCPGNTRVMGMRLKTEQPQGKHDDTALNGISFLCGNLGEPQHVLESRQITSLSGPWGDWGPTYVCQGGYAVGFQLRSEPSIGRGDDTAANNVRIYCRHGSGASLSISYLEGSGLGWGHWTQPQFCPYGWAMCSIQTQVEAPGGGDVDDTALNNVDVNCCPIPIK